MLANSIKIDWPFRIKTRLTTLCKVWCALICPRGLSRSIQLMHLDQACVEDFIRDLVEVVPVRLEMTKG